MNSAMVHSWALALAQLVVQVTLWLLVGTLLVALASRRSPRAASETVTWVLAGVLLLTALAASPWPAWCPLILAAEDFEAAPPIPANASHETVAAVAATDSWEIGPLELPAPPAEASAILPSPPLGEPANRVGMVSSRQTAGWVRFLALGLTTLAGVCLLRLAFALWAVRECRRRSRPVEDVDLQRLCTELRTAMGIQRLVELRELPGLDSPATLGWRHPVVLLPEDWFSWNVEERTSVLAHELAHIRRGDYAGWLLARLSGALHGYQPLIYWLLGRLRQDQELAADALAAQFAGGASCYTQSLCRLALRRDGRSKPGLARMFLPAHLSLTRRVQMLLSRSPKRKTARSVELRICLGIVLAAGWLTVAGLRSPAEAEETPKPLPAPAAKAVDVGPPARRSAKELEIERRLNMPITLQIAETPLRQVLDNLRDCSGIAIIVDKAALVEEQIDVETPVSLKIEGVSVKSALNLILRDLHLSWVIKDEVLQVTTVKSARGKLLQKTYSVADLVVPIENAPNREKPQTIEGQLIRLIVSTIAPATWSEAGGPGTIDYFPLGMALVINQTADVHEQVTDLLEALRRLQDVEVAVEVRLVAISEAMAGRLKLDFGVDCTSRAPEPGKDATRVTILEHGQLDKLLQKLQADRRTNIMQAPKLALFNGQNATIQTEDQRQFTTGMVVKWDGDQLVTTPKSEVYPVGFRIGVQAVAAADQRSVRLQLRARLSELDPAVPKTAVTATPNPGKRAVAGDKGQPLTQEVEQPKLVTLQLEQVISVPDGETAVLSGWKRPRLPTKQNARHPEMEYVVLLVTPRILINSAEETAPAVPNAPGRAMKAEQEAKLSDLLLKYQEACREKRFAEAKKLAAEALALDPGCFGRGR
jgi:beta-lactamase regulating signal transducer with metallopeptidase domain